MGGEGGSTTGYAAPPSSLRGFEDRSGLPPSAPEKTESVERSVEGLMQLVEEVDGLLVETSRGFKKHPHDMVSVECCFLFCAQK